MIGYMQAQGTIFAENSIYVLMLNLLFQLSKLIIVLFYKLMQLDICHCRLSLFGKDFNLLKDVDFGLFKVYRFEKLVDLGGIGFKFLLVDKFIGELFLQLPLGWVLWEEVCSL